MIASPDLTAVGDLCVWRGVVHTVGCWQVIPGVVMLGVQSRNDPDETFLDQARRDLAPRLNGGSVFWGHDKPRGRPLGTMAGCVETGTGIKGALVLDGKHPMTMTVVQAALRRPGSLAMSLHSPTIKAVLADGRTVVARVVFDAKDSERCSVDVVDRGAATNHLFA